MYLVRGPLHIIPLYECPDSLWKRQFNDKWRHYSVNPDCYLGIALIILYLIGYGQHSYCVNQGFRSLILEPHTAASYRLCMTFMGDGLILISIYIIRWCLVKQFTFLIVVYVDKFSISNAYLHELKLINMGDMCNKNGNFSNITPFVYLTHVIIRITHARLISGCHVLYFAPKCKLDFVSSIASTITF